MSQEDAKKKCLKNSKLRKFQLPTSSASKYITQFSCNMWAKNTASVLSRGKHHPQLSLLSRSLSTSVTKDVSSSPIADDGRHELWREGQSSDHDNEPRYVLIRRTCTRNACPSVEIHPELRISLQLQQSIVGIEGRKMEITGCQYAHSLVNEIILMSSSHRVHRLSILQLSHMVRNLTFFHSIDSLTVSSAVMVLTPASKSSVDF